MPGAWRVSFFGHVPLYYILLIYILHISTTSTGNSNCGGAVIFLLYVVLHRSLQRLLPASACSCRRYFLPLCLCFLVWSLPTPGCIQNPLNNAVLNEYSNHPKEKSAYICMPGGLRPSPTPVHLPLARSVLWTPGVLTLSPVRIFFRLSRLRLRAFFCCSLSFPNLIVSA